MGMKGLRTAGHTHTGAVGATEHGNHKCIRVAGTHKYRSMKVARAKYTEQAVRVVNKRASCKPASQATAVHHGGTPHSCLHLGSLAYLRRAAALVRLPEGLAARGALPPPPSWAYCFSAACSCGCSAACAAGACGDAPSCAHFHSGLLFTAAATLGAAVAAAAAAAAASRAGGGGGGAGAAERPHSGEAAKLGLPRGCCCCEGLSSAAAAPRRLLNRPAGAAGAGLAAPAAANEGASRPRC